MKGNATRGFPLPLHARQSQNEVCLTIDPLEGRTLLSASHPAQSNHHSHLRAAVGTARPGLAIYAPATAADATPYSSTAPVGLTPAKVRKAYGFDKVSFGAVQGTGAGQTIAIIDAYDSPTAYADLQAFDKAFALPDPPS